MNGGRKKLKKRYQSIESDDEMSVPEIDEGDDFPIASICKKNKSQASGKKTKEESAAEGDKETKNSDDKCKLEAANPWVFDSKDNVCIDLVDETEG